MKSTIFYWQLIALLCIGSSSLTDAYAQDGGGKNVSVFQQLDELRSKNAILTEELKNAELVNKLNASSSGGFAVPSMTAGMSNAPYAGGRGREGSYEPSGYLVKLVSGQKDSLRAVIIAPNGGRLTVRVGSKIDGLGIIKSISINEVVAVSGKSDTMIPFAGETSMQPFTGGANGVRN